MNLESQGSGGGGRRPRTLSAKGAASRQGILEASIRVIGRDGLDGASLGAVAQEAGTSKPAVLYHFGSRESLLHSVARAAMEQGVQMLSVGLANAVPTVSTSGHTRAVCEILFAKDNRPLLRCLHELLGLGMRDSVVGGEMERLFDAQARFLVSRWDNNAPADVYGVCRSIVMAVYGHLTLWLCADESDLTLRESAIRSALAMAGVQEV